MNPTGDALVARLRSNPDDVGAFAALRAHYEQLRDFASLVNLLEGWAGRNGQDELAAQALQEAGEIALRYLGDARRAVGLFDRALARQPQHDGAAERLQKLLEKAGDFRRLIEILERRAAALESARARPQKVTQVHLKLGQIWEHHGRHADRALFHFRKAIELDKTCVAAIYGAREIYRKAGGYKAAASLYELEVAAEPQANRKAALLCELAHLRMEHLGDHEGAVSVLARAQSLAPGDLSLLHDLATYRLKNAERLKEVPKANRERQQAADLLAQLAERVEGDNAKAYCEAALDVVPGHEGALAKLEELYEDSSEADSLAPRWVAYLRAEPTGSRADERRKRLGRAYLRAGQLDDAALCFETLLQKGDVEAVEVLADLYRGSNRKDDLARVLSSGAQRYAPPQRVQALRELVAVLCDLGRRDEAIGEAQALLQLDPTDGEACAFLEGEYARRRDFASLRQLMLTASRIPGLSADARKQRLREVAQISQTRLQDTEGALSALRAIIALDPSDLEARSALIQMLEASELWDELARSLEREASTADTAERAPILRRLGEVERDHRHDYPAAANVFGELYEICHDDEEIRDALCDALLLADRGREAIPLLRARIDASSSDEERVPLFRTLGSILEDCGDDESAFEVSARLLDVRPGDTDALDRMQGIDERNENYARLIETLSYRVEIAPPRECASILRRAGKLADEKLSDLNQAAEFYSQALRYEPDDSRALDALCDVYVRSDRYKDLLVILRERASSAEDPNARRELYRRIAKVLSDRIRNEEASIEAWREVLKSGEDEEALGALRVYLERREDWDELVDVLRRLGDVLGGAGGAVDRQALRELQLERATILSERLDRYEEAIDVIKMVLDRIDPNYVPAIVQLVRWCETLQDQSGLADALERQLASTPAADLRVPVARRLAEVYESQLGDNRRAISALLVWSAAAPTDPIPKRRLAPLLEAEQRWRELVAVLDDLVNTTSDSEEADELKRTAAQLVWKKLGDREDAWSRLKGQLEQGDERSNPMLKELAADFGEERLLAEYYVELAQRAESEDGRRWWVEASEIYESHVRDTHSALEAMLRAYAIDTSDEHMLSEVERLGAAAEAWDRLEQVYDSVLRSAEAQEDKLILLVRQARLLEERGRRSEEALNYLLRACGIAPDHDEVLEYAERLAYETGREEELLVVYDRRRATATSEADQLDASLRAIRVGDDVLDDVDRMLRYVREAVASVVRAPELRDVLEDDLRTLDDRHVQQEGRTALLHMLCQVYQDVADHRTEQSELDAAVDLLLRAARVYESDLGDEESAFLSLLRGMTIRDGGDLLLDECVRLAERTGRILDYAERLRRGVDEALDPETAARLLGRRALLLEEQLNDYSAAADAYRQLATIAPDEAVARDGLRRNLRLSGRYQELVTELEREADSEPDPVIRAAALKEAAQCWEDDLNNHWEAMDCWKRLQELVPEDSEVHAAVDRLGHHTRVLSSEEAMDRDSSLDDSVAATDEHLPDEIPEEVSRFHDVASMPEAEPAPEFESVSEPASMSEFEPDVDADATVALPPDHEPDSHSTGEEMLNELGTGDFEIVFPEGLAALSSEQSDVASALPSDHLVDEDATEAIPPLNFESDADDDRFEHGAIAEDWIAQVEEDELEEVELSGLTELDEGSSEDGEYDDFGADTSDELDVRRAEEADDELPIDDIS